MRYAFLPVGIFALAIGFVVGDANGRRLVARETARDWVPLAERCVGTASASSRLLMRCLAELTEQQRCVCFEQPLHREEL